MNKIRRKWNEIKFCFFMKGIEFNMWMFDRRNARLRKTHCKKGWHRFRLVTLIQTKNEKRLTARCFQCSICNTRHFTTKRAEKLWKKLEISPLKIDVDDTLEVTWELGLCYEIKGE